MKEPKYKIDQYVDTDFGLCRVLDIHISPTSGQIIYEVRTTENRISYPLIREDDVEENMKPEESY